MPEKPTHEPTRRSSDVHTPDEWSVLLAVPAWHHAAARQLHAWHVHEHHEGKPMQLTEGAYKSALAAALASPPEASPEAVSPHQGKGL